MNPKRLVIAVIAVFVGLWGMDFLIHAVWLQSTYAASKTLWRPEEELMNYMGWLTLGQFIAALAFVVIWAQGFAANAGPGRACSYGVFMGLLMQAATLVSYAVQPLPAALAIKWFVSGILEAVLLGLLVYLVYKPTAPAAAGEHVAPDASAHV